MLKFLKKVSSKWMLALATVASFACIMAIGSVDKKQTVSAVAETQEETVYYEGFEMEKGASVRIADGNGGIRFRTHVSAAAYAEINAAYPENKGITFYTLIARADKVADQDVENLTADFAKTSDYAMKGKATNQPDGTEDQFYQTALVVEDAENYGKAIMARGMAQVVDKNGNTQYVYAKFNENVRAMKEVAVEAIKDVKTTTDSGLTKYFTAKQAVGKGAVDASLGDLSTATAKMPALAEGETVVGVFQNGKKVDYSYENGTLTVTNTAEAFAAIEEGESLAFTVYTSANNTYSATVVKATKILRDYQDLAVFDIDEEEEKVYGYYVLDRDIDATGWSGNTHAQLTTANNEPANPVNLDEKICTRTGFFGTLDGFGYTIEMNMSGYGLFGNLFGTVQNTSFIFHETTAKSHAYGFGYWMGRSSAAQAELYNVNVTVENFGLASAANNTNQSSVLARRGNWLKLEKVSFEVKGVKEAVTSKTTGILIENASYWEATAEALQAWNKAGTSFTFAFIDVTFKTNVKNAPIMSTSNSGNICKMWASNDGKTEKLDDTTNWELVLGDYVCHQGWNCDGIVRADLDEKLEFLSIDEFSAYDGTIDWSFIGDETIVSATQGTTVLAADKANGTLKGVVPSISSGSYTGADAFSNSSAEPQNRKVSPVSVTVETSGGVYYIDVMAYTRVITTVDQLSMFDLTNTDNDFVKTDASRYRTIDGYFLLGNDITSDSFVNAHEYVNTDNNVWGNNNLRWHGFRGVFDGNGHTVTVPSSAKGLFGAMTRAYVKNVKFVFTETATSGSMGLTYWMSGAAWSQRCSLTDVTITVNGFGASNADGLKSAAIANQMGPNLTFTNVEVNVNYATGVAANKTTGILANMTTGDLSVAVTVVESETSGAPLAYNKSNNGTETFYWASNDGKTADSSNKIIASAIRQVKAA